MREERKESLTRRQSLNSRSVELTTETEFCRVMNKDEIKLDNCLIFLQISFEIFVTFFI